MIQMSVCVNDLKNIFPFNFRLFYNNLTESSVCSTSNPRKIPLEIVRLKVPVVVFFLQTTPDQFLCDPEPSD